MRLVNYRWEQATRIGFLLDNRVFDLERILQARGKPEQRSFLNDKRIPITILEALQAGQGTWYELLETHRFLSERYSELVRQPGMALLIEHVSLLPPVHRPGKIVCVGLNYPPAGSEPSSTKPEYPVLFHKVVTSLSGHMAPITIPAISQRVEYEGELAIIIGQSGKYIPREQALDYVAGYTIANDVGAKDIEQRTSQWTSGKMLDSFCPLGPALVSRDQIPEPNALHISTTLNGELVQDGNTEEMIFDVAYLVSYISNLATLEPGDLILSGSPKRLGTRPDPRKALQPGDMVVVEIEKLGRLANPVVAEEV